GDLVRSAAGPGIDERSVAYLGLRDRRGRVDFASVDREPACGQPQVSDQVLQLDQRMDGHQQVAAGLRRSHGEHEAHHDDGTSSRTVRAIWSKSGLSLLVYSIASVENVRMTALWLGFGTRTYWTTRQAFRHPSASVGQSRTHSARTAGPAGSSTWTAVRR